jgi:LysM repeat protein
VSRTRKLVFVLGITAALLAPGMARVAARQTHPVPLRLVHVVRSGETLWQIARAVAPGDDVTATVDRLMASNHLRSPVLRPGQPLYLPGS